VECKLCWKVPIPRTGPRNVLCARESLVPIADPVKLRRGASHTSLVSGNRLERVAARRFHVVRPAQDTMLAPMASAADFLKYWALAFVTLSLALFLLSIFYQIIDSDLGLDGFRKEALVALVASTVQAAGFWFSASLFPGDPFRTMLLPGLMVAFIYRLTHLKDWNGLDIGGVFIFQSIIIGTAFCLTAGHFKLAAIVLAVFIGGLAIIGSIAKSL
jgi:hypothetical protein